MAESNRDKFYVDACCFLAYLKKEEITKKDGTIVKRHEIVKEYLKRSYEGKIQLLTSTSTITETAFLQSEKDAGKTSKEVEELLDAFFDDRKTITPVDSSIFVAKEARNLMRKCIDAGMKSLTPIDAIHLASAKRVGAISFLTYDMKTIKPYEMIAGITIQEPQSFPKTDSEQDTLF